MIANAAPATVALGIIGCGRATRQLHLPALRHVPAIRVVALADTDGRRLEQTAEQFGVAGRYTDAEALIEADECDAIAVCVPVGAHADTAVRALAADKHVFVEKP